MGHNTLRKVLKVSIGHQEKISQPSCICINSRMQIDPAIKKLLKENEKWWPIELMEPSESAELRLRKTDLKRWFANGTTLYLNPLQKFT